MLTAVLLGGGLAVGIPPVIIAIAALAAIEPRLVLAGAAVWGIVAAIRRRPARVAPDDEATLFRAMAAELRSGASLRSALAEAAHRVPQIALDRPVRLAAAGMSMTDVAGSVEVQLPVNGRLAAAAFRLSDWSGARVADTFEGLRHLRRARRESGGYGRTGERAQGGDCPGPTLRTDRRGRSARLHSPACGHRSGGRAGCTRWSRMAGAGYGPRTRGRRLDHRGRDRAEGRTMMALAALALGVAILRSNRREVLAAGILVAFALAPVLGIGLSLGLVVWIVMKRRPRSSGFNDDEAMLAELTALGLSAGLTFIAAASAAVDSVPGEASAQLRQTIRVGAGMDTETVDGHGLMVVVHRALLTGAPLQPAVSGYATTLRNEERSRELTAARRLPVKLLFPLALLILPGFLILTIGPAVLGSLERLGI